jgi:hypothetical protein
MHAVDLKPQRHRRAGRDARLVAGVAAGHGKQKRKQQRGQASHQGILGATRGRGTPRPAIRSIAGSSHTLLARQARLAIVITAPRLRRP